MYCATRVAVARREKNLPTHSQGLHRDIPDDEGADAGAVLVDDDVVLDVGALGPAGLILHVGGIVVVLEGDGAGDHGLDGDVGDGPLVRMGPVRRRGRGGRGRGAW